MVIDVEDNTRNRLLALLVAVTAVFAAATVIVLFTTGSFGPVWFAASLLVYGTLATVGVGLAVLEPTEDTDATPETEPVAATQTSRIELGESEVLYETPTGRVLRTVARSGEDLRELLFAVTRDEVALVDDVERALDRLDIEVDGPAARGDVEDELERRGARRPGIRVDPDAVPVEVTETRVLYETETGRLVWARYRTPDGDRETLFAVQDGEATPIDEIEGRIDGLPLSSSPDDEALQTALRDHTRPTQEPTPEVTNP